MLIQTRNLLPEQAPYTYTTYPEVAGTNVMRWKNADQMQPSWAVQVGATGIPQSEIVVLGTANPSGTAGTLTANTLFEHPSDTPLYGIKYDQIVFEVSTTGTGGVALPITNGTVTIQPNAQYTMFDHTSGTTSYAYKTYFRNSVLGSTTTESDWITPAGFSFYSLAKIRERVRGRLYNSDYLLDGDIDNFTNEWLQMMHNAQVDVNEDYGLGTTTIAFATNIELGTMTATDFRGGFKRVWLVDASGTYTANKMDSNSFSPTRIFTTLEPFYYMQGDTVIGRKPSEAAGTFVVEYYKQTPMLVNDTDELPIPMQSFTKSFIDYGNAMSLHKDNKHQEASPYEASAAAQLAMFKTQIAPRNVSSSSMMDIVESASDSDIGWY
jgi:hypothetical protein